jgi:lantibiotic biosynthesis protein
MRQIVQKELDRLNIILAETPHHQDRFLKGGGGLAYYFYHQYLADKQISWLNKSVEIASALAKQMTTPEFNHANTSFETGMAGLAYLLSFIAEKTGSTALYQSYLHRIDEYLLSAAIQQLENGPLGFFNGAFGIMQYFACKKNKTALDLLANKLNTRIVQQGNRSWFSSPAQPHPEEKQIALGLSHGLSGQLLVLLNLYRLLNHRKELETLIENGINFILSYRMEADFSEKEFSLFPTQVNMNASEIENSPVLCWSNGDLNQALLLHRFGSAYDKPQLVRNAEMIGLHSLLRQSSEATCVYNSNFYNGSAGLAHSYLTLYNETGLPQYREGYHYWIEKTVLFLADDMEKGLYKGREENISDGLAGVGLVLLSFTAPETAVWSRALLL